MAVVAAGLALGMCPGPSGLLGAPRALPGLAAPTAVDGEVPGPAGDVPEALLRNGSMANLAKVGLGRFAGGPATVDGDVGLILPPWSAAGPGCTCSGMPGAAATPCMPACGALLDNRWPCQDTGAAGDMFCSWGGIAACAAGCCGASCAVFIPLPPLDLVLPLSLGSLDLDLAPATAADRAAWPGIGMPCWLLAGGNGATGCGISM